MKSVILKATELSKTYYDPRPISVLKDIHLEVFKGESIAIMGRSGEGKSTLLHILGTLENSCSGKLHIAGSEVNSFNKPRIRNKHIGFIFQSFHLFNDLTVLENVLLPASIGRHAVRRNSPAWKHAHSLLATVGLEERIHFPAKLLSGGEKQRVAIARALCNDPDILLADEPSGNLDSVTAEGIHRLLTDFARSQGKTLIVVTHDHSLAALCDRQFLINEGHISLS
ncbi:MAG: ABC transporter ATP-binding protein [Chlamydiales bacterium]